jgi:hypothetical protein
VFANVGETFFIFFEDGDKCRDHEPHQSRMHHQKPAGFAFLDIRDIHVNIYKMKGCLVGCNGVLDEFMAPVLDEALVVRCALTIGYEKVLTKSS